MLATGTALKPLPIGDITISTPLFLAPMAGHTNYALRRLCRELGGCGLVCTELISSNIVKNSRERALQRFDWRADEHPVAVQLFGVEPQIVAEAARVVVDHGADIVDINMGCWVPKIAKKGGGAALLRDVKAATAVVEAVVKAVAVPVTVKVRSGFEDGVVTAVPFAVAAEAVGAQAVAVHARFAGQGHSGEADWDVIAAVKDVVCQMPIIGNGDVHSGADARRMLECTCCDGVMIGRAALGRPWLFQHIAHYMDTGVALPEPSRSERALIALRHAKLTLETTHLPEHVALLEMRGQISTYQLDPPGSRRIRNRLVRIESFAELESILLGVACETK
ncbi:MAG: tRNA dihydrouridine synthase DusB [Chloroflexota bacterium]|nr:tRNA dihydrouridine synthase DusB [Chloroflexota bacterium]MDE2908862.1 tRNA dihydrouridine synthase DusB [Chloroflexota bacterium]